MIQLQQVSKRYRGGVEALSDVSLVIGPQDAVCLLGPSGSGKTTLLKLLTREELPTSGTLTVDDVDLRKLPAPILRLYRQRLGIVFQDLRLLAHLTAVENVALPLELAGRDPLEIGARLETIFTRLKLIDCARAFPHTLPAGRRRLIALARAVVTSPVILVIDELATDLDPEQLALAMDLLQELQQSGTTLVLTTHDPNFAAQSGARVVPMAHGRIVGQTPPAPPAAGTPPAAHHILERDRPADPPPRARPAVRPAPAPAPTPAPQPVTPPPPPVAVRAPDPTRMAPSPSPAAVNPEPDPEFEPLSEEPAPGKRVTKKPKVKITAVHSDDQ